MRYGEFRINIGGKASDWFFSWGYNIGLSKILLSY